MSVIKDNTRMPTKSKNAQRFLDELTEADYKSMYEYMVLTRSYDERGFKLQRQGRIGFYAGSRGEEACQIGTAYALGQRDWIFSSYRQPGVAMFRGIPLQDMVNNLYGNSEDIVEGRQMPVHYTSRQHHFLSISSVIGTQVIQAAGAAIAAKVKKEDSVVLTYFGDGGTSSSDFHSGMNFAATFKAPCIFGLINNQYAISTPLSKQTGMTDLYKKAEGYGMPGIQVDGNNILEVYSATREAVERARNGEGPTLLELKTYRAGPHSSSDDPSRYREQAETDEWLKRDPIEVMKQLMQERGFWSEEFETEVWESAKTRINDAVQHAESLPEPEWNTLFESVYSYVPQVLADQRDDILAHEKGLELTNEGEFPL